MEVGVELGANALHRRQALRRENTHQTVHQTLVLVDDLLLLLVLTLEVCLGEIEVVERGKHCLKDLALRRLAELRLLLDGALLKLSKSAVRRRNWSFTALAWSSKPTFAAWMSLNADSIPDTSVASSGSTCARTSPPLPSSTAACSCARISDTREGAASATASSSSSSSSSSTTSASAAFERLLFSSSASSSS